MNTKHIFKGLLALVLLVLVGTVEASAQLKKNVELVQKVVDQALYQKNLVSDLTFTVNTDSREISVPGILRMRKDEVIRLQLLIPLLRSEAGRIEFTPSYVLFIDRIHKQYVKATYEEVAFLRNNGIDFYSLQALFWNQLFVPGQKKVGEDGVYKFNVDTSAKNGALVPIMLKDGKMQYKWMANYQTGLIGQAEAKYNGSDGVSVLRWNYSDFREFGSKTFPAQQDIVIEAVAKKKTIKASLELEKITANDTWESFTTPSDKYRQVGVDEILDKLMML